MISKQFLQFRVQFQKSASSQSYYLPLVDTPYSKQNDERREVDDFQPRAYLRALYKEKAINVEDALRVQVFCE